MFSDSFCACVHLYIKALALLALGCICSLYLPIWKGCVVLPRSVSLCVVWCEMQRDLCRIWYTLEQEVTASMWEEMGSPLILPALTGQHMSSQRSITRWNCTWWASASTTCGSSHGVREWLIPAAKDTSASRPVVAHPKHSAGLPNPVNLVAKSQLQFCTSPGGSPLWSAICVSHS